MKVRYNKDILLLILFLIIIFETYKITEFNKDIMRTREIYLAKTDLVFNYLLLHNISFISLAETLEQLSTVYNEDYQQVQKLLDLAKLQTEQWENSLYHLIYVSDTRERKLSFDHGVNNFIMSTQQQQDIFIRVFSAAIRNVIRSISWHYANTTPKQIKPSSRLALKEISEQLREMDKTMISLKNKSSSIETSMIADNEKLLRIQQLKIEFLNEIKPHLEKIGTVADKQKLNLTQ